MENQKQNLINTIHGFSKALWLKNSLELALLICFYAAIIMTSIIIVVKLGFLVIPFWDYLIILTIGFSAGLLTGLSKRPSLHQTALFLDDALFLQNRLTTSLECTLKKNPNAIEKILLNKTMPKITPSLAYSRFNMNYVFQFILSALAVTAILLLPSAASEAEESLNSILNEHSAKIENTTRSIKDKENLDGITKSLISQMESISHAISQSSKDPQEILNELKTLKDKTENNIRELEIAENLITQITLIFNKDYESNLIENPKKTQKLLKEIKKSISKGNVNINTLSQLKNILEKSLNNLKPESSSSKNLLKTLKALEEANILLTEPLNKFFNEISLKNKEITDILHRRIKIAQREISKVLLKQSQTQSTTRDPLSQKSFSLANSRQFAPLHTSDQQQPYIITDLPMTENTTIERIELLKEVLESRTSSFQNPTWPDKYDDVIKEYFKN